MRFDSFALNATSDEGTEVVVSVPGFGLPPNGINRAINPRLSVFESGLVPASGDGAVSPRSSSAPGWVGGESETSWAGRISGSSANRVTSISWVLFEASGIVRVLSGAEALLATKIRFVVGGLDEGADLDPLAEGDWLVRGTPPTAAAAVVGLRVAGFVGVAARLVFAAVGFNSISS